MMIGAKVIALCLFLFQGEGAPAFDLISMWRGMGWPARLVVVVLLIMSAWSTGVIIDRWIAYQASWKESRVFAPAVAGALKDGNIREAIAVSEHNQTRQRA